MLINYKGRAAGGGVQTAQVGQVAVRTAGGGAAGSSCRPVTPQVHRVPAHGVVIQGCASGDGARGVAHAAPCPAAPPREAGGGGRAPWPGVPGGCPGGRRISALPICPGGACSPRAPATMAPAACARRLRPADISKVRSSQRHSLGESACVFKYTALNFTNFTTRGARIQFHSKCHEGRAELFAVPFLFVFFFRIHDSGNSEY